MQVSGLVCRSVDKLVRSRTSAKTSMSIGKPLVLTIFVQGFETVTAFCCFTVIRCFLHGPHKQFVAGNLCGSRFSWIILRLALLLPAARVATVTDGLSKKCAQCVVLNFILENPCEETQLVVVLSSYIFQRLKLQLVFLPQTHCQCAPSDCVQNILHCFAPALCHES